MNAVINRNRPRALGIDRDYDSIDVNKVADLVVLKGTPYGIPLLSVNGLIWSSWTGNLWFAAANLLRTYQPLLFDISNIISPAATPAFKEDILPFMGIFTR